MNKILFWDFDGTLGYRRDGMWGASMLEALRRYDPDTSLTAPSFRPFLISGFPWHNPHLAHTHIASADAWWEPILHRFAEGFMHYGINRSHAMELAVSTREIFLDLERWQLFDDTPETLTRLSRQGWQHAVVSNHVPELADIVQALGLHGHLTHFINSAIVGYEKPNRRIFEHALEVSGSPNQVWMIGDNIEADYWGAEAAGIPAILVRTIDQRAARNAASLADAVRWIAED